MSQKGLSAREISWLLAQEARGAAQALRQGIEVQVKEQAVPSTRTPDLEPPSRSGQFLDSLATLDDAMTLLGNLQQSKQSHRRGRIDVAALLYELAPSAKIQLTTTTGTEVFGDEDNVKRMLQLLLSASSPHLDRVESTAPHIELQRAHEFVCVTCSLGPDAALDSTLERRWLNRMASRAGGRLETTGHSQTLLLPADGFAQEKELLALRSELTEAQELGESYARELALVLMDAEAQVKANAADEIAHAAFDSAVTMARAVQALLISAEPYGGELLQLVLGLVEQAERPTMRSGSANTVRQALADRFKDALTAKNMTLTGSSNEADVPVDACTVAGGWLLCECIAKGPFNAAIALQIQQTAAGFEVTAQVHPDSAKGATADVTAEGPPSRGVLPDAPGPAMSLLSPWIRRQNGSLTARINQLGNYELTVRIDTP